MSGGLVERLLAFANGCRGSMWQSRNETIELCDEAAATITALQAEVARLKREVGRKDDALHEKNLALDAMGWVWCDGGCRGGTGRFTEFVLTDEHATLMERQAKRARTFLVNRGHRAALGQQP